MNISTKSRYGLRAIMYLGLRYSNEKVSIKEISEKEDVSKRYLEQIFSELKKGGIIKSIKGTKGGYFLSKSPSEITVGEVLRLLEGNLNIIDADDKCNYKVEDIEYTLINKVWEKINGSIKNVVDHITIDDLINDYNSINHMMFYI